MAKIVQWLFYKRLAVNGHLYLPSIIMKINTILFWVLAIWVTKVNAGTINLSLSSLPAFGNVYVFNSSTSQYYLLNATALTAPLEITAPSGFEVSLNYKSGYAEKVVLNAIGGNITNKLVYVRFSPSVVGTASGSVNHTSVGSSSVNINVAATAIAWAIPASYYSTVNSQLGAALKTVLYNKILGHTTQSYTPGVWNAYSTTDRYLNDSVWDIYGMRLDSTSPYTFYMVNNQCGSYSIEGDCYNREHSFPQSWFNNASPMVSDVHHIFASDGKVNGMRNNYPFGFVSNATYTPAYGGKLGTGSNFGYVGTVYEQIDEYKGDFARAYFYMATRYENLIASWNAYGNANDVLDGTSYPAYDAWFLNVLLAWHNIDPVSDKEIKRNNAIYAIQNNRNPFVDSPQFVTKIWGGALPVKPNVSASNLTITNISNTSVKLNWTSGNGFRRMVIVKPLTAVNSLPTDTVHYLANANLAVAPQITAGNYVVYNGTGSAVTITNLQAGVNYYYAVVEYNGWYNTTNYFTSGVSLINGVTLPVSWLNFSGKRNEVGVDLSWQTASEKNNIGFYVERSADGKVFDEIGFVRGQLNANTISNYAFTDENAAYELTLFYRLKQIDADGRFSYSNVIAIMPQSEVLAPNIYPNPVQNKLYIKFKEPIGTSISYMVTDYTGKLIKQEYEQVPNNENTVVVNNSDLHAGVYFVQIEFNHRNYRFKFLKN